LNNPNLTTSWGSTDYKNKPEQTSQAHVLVHFADGLVSPLIEVVAGTIPVILVAKRNRILDDTLVTFGLQKGSWLLLAFSA
jgi:hypothetical protein